MSVTQNAAITITYTNFAAPAGSVVDHITVTCLAANPANNQTPQSVPAGTTALTFNNLVPDTYTFAAQAFPASGPGFGSAVTTTLVVTGSTVTLQIPGTLDATQP